MAVVEISKIQVRRGQENTTGVPILDSGEFGWASDTERLYIGLRRIDGGARDANVRILTENDLRNFFSSSSTSGATGSTSSNYTFRNDTFIAVTATSYTPADLIVRSVQKKLDDIVNVKDFGAVGDGVNVDTAYLQAALSYLYLRETKNDTGIDVSYNTFTEKILYFPSGVYRINETLEIPGQTRIMGEGIGNTKIVQISTGSSVFRTVYNNSAFTIPPNGFKFTFGTSTSASNLPNNISIEKLTIKHEDSTFPTSEPFILLEESSNVTIRDVRLEGISQFETYANNSTSTYVGIEVRGNTGTYNTKNILIENCQFENLFAGFRCDYDVDSVTLNQCKFTKLDKGVVLSLITGTSVAYNGPRFVKVTNSYFDEIRQEAIYAGENPSLTPTYHISEKNVFEDVGNGGYGFTSETGTSIISFLTDANISRNDFFRRYSKELEASNLTTTTALPLILGNLTVENDNMHNVLIEPANTASVILLPLNNQAQLVNVTYSLADGAQVDRQGYLKINVKAGANPFVAVEEGFNYYNALGPSFLQDQNSAFKFLKFSMYNPPGAGTGANFQVTRNPWPVYTGALTTGTYTNLVVTSAGSGYVAGEQLTIIGGAIGGATPANNLVVSVDTVNGSGGVLTASIVSGQSADITTSTVVGPIGSNAYTTNRDVSFGPIKFSYKTSIITHRV